MLSSGCSVYGKKLSQASLSPSLPSHNRTATWNVAKIKNYTTRTLQTWSFSLTEENMTLLELRSKLQTRRRRQSSSTVHESLRWEHCSRICLWSAFTMLRVSLCRQSVCWTSQNKIYWSSSFPSFFLPMLCVTFSGDVPWDRLTITVHPALPPLRNKQGYQIIK